MASSRSLLGGSDEDYSKSLLGGSNDVNDIQCEPCMKEGITVDAVKHCVDCAKYLCGQCFKNHAKFKAFQNHVTNDVTTVNPVTKTSSKITTSTVRDALSELQIDPKPDQQTSSRADAKSSVVSKKKVTAWLVSSMDVRSSIDNETPYIKDLTTVRSYYCVVNDHVNKSVKVVDTRHMCVVSEAHVSDADDLYAITSVNDDQVALSVTMKGEQYKLMFFSVSTSGIISHTDKSLDMGTLYRGIIHHQDRLYGSRYNGIDIISMNGQIIKTIEDDLFGGLYGIALSNDHNTIYVCSFSGNVVFSVDLECNINASYMDQDMSTPADVTVDSEGYVYVCSFGTDCVHQFTFDLLRVQVIINRVGGVRCTLNRAENRLYVAMYDKIKTYHMIYE